MASRRYLIQTVDLICKVSISSNERVCYAKVRLHVLGAPGRSLNVNESSGFPMSACCGSSWRLTMGNSCREHSETICSSY